MSTANKPPPLPNSAKARNRGPWKWIFGFVALIPLAIIAFYVVENWRGKRAWERCQQALAAKGEKTNWSDFIPTAVPEDQNAFTTPKISEWFVGRSTNELFRLLSINKVFDFCRTRYTNCLVELTISTNAAASEDPVDAVLHYDRFALSCTTESPSNYYGSPTGLIELIQMEDVSLSAAVSNLALQAGLTCVIDSKLHYGEGHSDEPIVNIRWENLTAEQALFSILDVYELKWEENEAGVIRISKGDGRASVYIYPAARDQIKQLLHQSAGMVSFGPQNRRALGPQGFSFTSGRLTTVQPVRFRLQTSKDLWRSQIVDCFPGRVSVANQQFVSLRMEAVKRTFYRGYLGPNPIAATDYLEWSEQFTNQFALIREALKRPKAQMEGDYQDPYLAPFPNQRTIKITAETLAQRAICYLLLNEPEKAFDELALLHGMIRMLDIDPGRKMVSVPSAFTSATITEIYVNAIKEGFSLHAWREPQLITLQEQLSQIDLLRILKDGIRTQRAAAKRSLQMALTNAPTQEDDLLRDAQKMLNRRMTSLYPHGWVLQNLVHITDLEQKAIEALDPTNRTVVVSNVTAFTQGLHRYDTNNNIYASLVTQVVPNLTHLIIACAKIQNLADEANIACALERYQLSHGELPATLEALTPSFLKKIPHDIINGKPLRYHPTTGRFQLYSVGWNETDDGGKAPLDPDGTVNLRAGDWLWATSQ